jgi:hypothetical protein
MRKIFLTLQGRKPTVDVQVVLGKHLWPVVDRVARAVEDATQHVLCDRKFHGATREFNVGGLDVYAGCALEDLHDGLLPLNLKDLTAAPRSIRKGQSDDLVI